MNSPVFPSLDNIYCTSKVDACFHWEKIEKRFSIFEFRLGINFFHFRLRRFEQVGSRLGSPEAGVEIDIISFIQHKRQSREATYSYILVTCYLH